MLVYFFANLFAIFGLIYNLNAFGIYFTSILFFGPSSPSKHHKILSSETTLNSVSVIQCATDESFKPKKPLK